MFCCIKCMADAKAGGVALQRADAADPLPRASAAAPSAAEPEDADALLESHPAPKTTSDPSGGCCVLQ
jgi:hypothetical protein